MLNKNKAKLLEEIESISSEALRRFLRDAMERFPKYFWTVPASVSGYHPPDEREEGGLVLHVRRLIKLADDMAYMHALNRWETDVLKSAAVLHDSFTRGIPPNEKTASDPLHPVFPEVMFPYNGDVDRFLPGEAGKRLYDEIMECVSSHSGRFSPLKALISTRKLPSIFQTMDFLGSRPHIIVKV